MKITTAISTQRYGSTSSRQITINQALTRANQGIRFYLARELTTGRISQSAHDASLRAIPSIKEWLTNSDIHRLSPNTRTGIVDAITDKRWNELIDAHYVNVTFGTAGIRGKAVNRSEDLDLLFHKGLGIPMLKGPNWISDLVVMRVTQGVMNWMNESGFKKVMIGYDSRAAGNELAELVAKIAIANNIEVMLMDKVSPFPTLTYMITQEGTRADVGILISASHNVAGDNGYKITVADGSQFDQKTRTDVIKIINAVQWLDIKVVDGLSNATEGQLVWLGGTNPVAGKDYYDRAATLINVEDPHIDGMYQHFLNTELFQTEAPALEIGHAAYNGAGAEVFPTMLERFGLQPGNIYPISSLRKVDGRFKAFIWGQQPDPGGIYGAGVAVKEFIAEYGAKAFFGLNGLFGTDPDADRLGLTIPLPVEFQAAFKSDWYLSTANLLWAVLAHYRLSTMARINGGEIPNKGNLYGMISHTTSPWIGAVTEKHGIAMKGRLLDTQNRPLDVPKQGRAFWVGMNEAAANSVYYRDQGLFNIFGAEESNGWSIFGGPVLPGQVLGQNSWVRDKDGTFAGAMSLEVLAYLQTRGISFLDYVGEIAKFVGHYMGTWNEPLPHVGQWVGPSGTELKLKLLKVAENWAKQVQAGRPIEIAGQRITEAYLYATGKYDEELYKGAPDQGVELITEKGDSTIIRPSGTGNNLRYYTFAGLPAQFIESLGLPQFLANTNRSALDLAARMQLASMEAIGINAGKDHNESLAMLGN